MDQDPSAQPPVGKSSSGDQADSPSIRKTEGRTRRSRIRVHVAWAGALVIAVVLAITGTLLVIRPYAQPTANAPTVATYTAKMGQLAVSANTEATVSFLKGPPSIAPTSGTITSVGIDSTGTISTDQQIYAVDLRPVIAAVGVVPAFRAMQRGETGPDIAQLRSFLGLPAGQSFDRATELAVRKWQSSNGITATGVVEFGDVVFLPQLPTRGYLAAGVVVGAQVDPGQIIVQTVQARPQVSVTDSAGTLGLKSGMTATIESGKAAVAGTLNSPVASGNGGISYPITTADGQSPCDITCAASFSISSQSQTPVSVQTVPKVVGVLVPASALAVAPGGQIDVVSKNGAMIPVTIVTQANGLAIVKGLVAGTSIRLFSKGSSG